MIIYDVKSCDYCKSTIAASQRWVREKTYDPRSNSQVPVYHHYHAELFGGQEGSCWEKHQIRQRNCSNHRDSNQMGGRTVGK